MAGVGVVTVSERRSTRPSGEGIGSWLLRSAPVRRAHPVRVDRADEALLHHRYGVDAVAAEDGPHGQAPASRGRRAGLAVEQPLIGPERAAEPHGLVEAG